MTQEQLDIITKVINNIAPRYVFGYFSLEDIKQEAYLFALEGFSRYDETKPLENFISKHISNKLKSLVRDKYYRKKTNNAKHQQLNESKKALIDTTEIIPETLYYEIDFEDQLSTKDKLDYIMDNLSPALRRDFLRMANGVSLQSYRTAAVKEEVRRLMNERDW